jgi:membrane fusion protein, multidrug efflux system
MRLLPLISPAIIFSLVILSSCKEEKKQAAPAAGAPNRNMPVRVDGFLVQAQTIRESIEAPGTLLPNEETNLQPEVSGRVVALNINEGQVVGKGTLLVKIFDGDLQAQLKKLYVQLATAEKTVERQTELLKINGISQQEVDLSQLQVNTIKADIDIVKTNIAKTELRAPFNGRLGFKNISIGAYITPQTIVAALKQVDKLKIDFTVPEKYSSRIKTGMFINFTIEGNLQKHLAKVMATEPAITENNRSLRVRAVVDVKDKALIPGAFAKVKLQFDEVPNTIMIPTQAVLPQARNKKVVVYRNGVAVFETVTTGIRDSSMVQIVAGLNTGDTIVTTGLLAIKPDAKLQLNKVAQ